MTPLISALQLRDSHPLLRHDSSSKFSVAHSAVCDATCASSSSKSNKKTGQTFSRATNEVPPLPDGGPSVFRSDGRTVQEPVKGTGVKKRKKKRRFGKRSSHHAETSGQTSPEAASLCGPTGEEASDSSTYDASRSHFSAAPGGSSSKEEKPSQTTDAQCDRNRNGPREGAGESTRAHEDGSRVIFDFNGFVPEEPLQILVFGSLAVAMHSDPGKHTDSSGPLNVFREGNKAVGEVSKLGAKSGKVSPGLSEVSVATANEATADEGQRRSSDGALRMRGALHSLRVSGKENSGLAWQRVQGGKTGAAGASPRAQRQNFVASREAAQRSGACKVLGLPQKTSHRKLGQPHGHEGNRERRSAGSLEPSLRWVTLSRPSFSRAQSQGAAIFRRGNNSEGRSSHDLGESTPGAASARASLAIPTHHLPVGEVNGMRGHDQNITKCGTVAERSVLPGLAGARKEFPRGISMPGTAEQSSVRITSQAAFQILSASHRSQMASEQAEVAGGGPIAAFEKLMAAVSPVIVPSVDHAGLPDASLADVWSWYEEPGAYGLGVRAEPSRNRKNWGRGGLPFQAYFVPSLSAVQLFSHQGDNNVGAKTTQEEKPWPDSSYAEDSLLSCCQVEAPDDSALLFEYFEHERPDQRKPLCAK